MGRARGLQPKPPRGPRDRLHISEPCPSGGPVWAARGFANPAPHRFGHTEGVDGEPLSLVSDAPTSSRVRAGPRCHQRTIRKSASFHGLVRVRRLSERVGSGKSRSARFPPRSLCARSAETGTMGTAPVRYAGYAIEETSPSSGDAEPIDEIKPALQRGDGATGDLTEHGNGASDVATPGGSAGKPGLAATSDRRRLEQPRIARRASSFFRWE